MIDIKIPDSPITLKDVIKSLKAVVANADFYRTLDTLTRRDKIVIRMADLLIDPANQYFCPEARLIISSRYISLADVIRIMDERGEHISRSGCENRILLSMKQFVQDFGADAAQLLSDTKPIANQSPRLDEIEIRLLSIEQGFDFTSNIIDKYLSNHNIKIDSVRGFSAVDKITPGQIKQFLAIIEPYTPKGLERRKKQLEEMSAVLWHFRKATVDGSDDEFVNYILRSIM